MIEPDVSPRPHRRRATTALVVTALLAGLGGIAVAVSSGGDDGAVSANGKVANPASGTPSLSQMSADEEAGGTDSAGSRSMVAPSWSGLEITVDGDLPELGGRGAAYGFYAPEMTAGDAARVAGAFGMTVTAVVNEGGGWTFTDDNGRLQIFPGTDGWSVNYQRAGWADGVDGRISAEAAEQTARGLLTDMGVFDGEWQAKAYESTSQGGFDADCEEALKRLEAERTTTGGGSAGSTGSGTADGTEPAIAPDRPASIDEDYKSPPECDNQMPEPSFAQNVSFHAVLDGTRTDWAGWTVNVRADNVVDAVYGTWVDFGKGETYELRGTAAALEELKGQGMGRTMPVPMPTDTVLEGSPAPAGAPAATGVAVDPAVTSAVAPDAPVSSPAAPAENQPAEDMPAVDLPADPCAAEGKCAVQKVTITSVERSYTVATLWTDGTARTHLVPAYRFLGQFEGSAQDGAETGANVYDATVLAVDPAVTMPPAGFDKTVPPAEIQSTPSR